MVTFAAIQIQNPPNPSNVFSNKTVRKLVRSGSPYAARTCAEEEEEDENAENPCKHWGFRHSLRSVSVRYFLLKSGVRKKLENRLPATAREFESHTLRHMRQCPNTEVRYLFVHGVPGIVCKKESN